MKKDILLLSILICLIISYAKVLAVPPPCLEQPEITYVSKTFAANMPCGEPMVLCWLEYTYGIRTILINGVETKEIVIENVDINSDCPCIDYFQKSILKYILNYELEAMGVSSTLNTGDCDTVTTMRVTQQGCYSAQIYFKNGLQYTRFTPCEDSECCYDKFRVIYCKTNCPYPTCTPIVSYMTKIGEHTINNPCVPPCYSWCGKYSFEDPNLVDDLENVTTSNPYNGPFVPKVSLENGLNSNKDIKIIPNPVNSICSIEIDNEYYENAKVMIYDVSGNVISTIEKKKEIGLLSIMTNLSGLQSGTYYCIILMDGIEIGNSSFVITK